VSGAFSVRLSFFISLSRTAGSLKGVPSGEVVRLEGELCWRSLGLLRVGAGLVPGAVAEEGLTEGAAFSPRSFLGLPGGVVAGLEAGLTGAAALGIGEALSARLSFPLSLSGAAAGLAAVAGAVEAAGLAGAAGLAPVAGIGLPPAGAAFAFGVKLGGGTVLGSSFFIFSFSSA
jgi:hypothetical protein